jgi:hypothetical protein
MPVVRYCHDGLEKLRQDKHLPGIEHVGKRGVAMLGYALIGCLEPLGHGGRWPPASQVGVAAFLPLPCSGAKGAHVIDRGEEAAAVGRAVARKL